MYIWQQSDWPEFHWNEQALSPLLIRAHGLRGRLMGRLEGLGLELRSEARLQSLTLEVVKSSEIEGETLDQDQVRSSIARRLGLDIAGLVAADRRVEGIVEMQLDATGNASAPLTQERLCSWQAALFPTGFSGLRPVLTGQLRTDAEGPMQVVSGPVGRERLHFEAPPADQLDAELRAFLNWFERPPDTDALLHAGLAHLWFVTLHPFEDGNGRLARAIADMALARGEGVAQRAWSMSAQIRQERSDYYEMLERSQKGSLDVTAWLEWFLGCMARALESAQLRLDGAIAKAEFWARFGRQSLNPRQVRVLERVLREDWEGKLTSSKWAKIAGCSQDTAGRDIKDLLERGALVRDPGGGRSTSYSVKLELSSLIS